MQHLSSLKSRPSASFAPTGADWLVEPPHFLTLFLGPNWKEARDIVNEARWFSDRYTALKKGRVNHWKVIVDLGRISQWRFAPLEMARIYTRMIQDPKTERVAITRSSPWQQQFIKLFLWTQTNAQKIAFFGLMEDAENWLQKPHSSSVHDLVCSPSCTLVAAES